MSREGFTTEEGLTIWIDTEYEVIDGCFETYHVELSFLPPTGFTLDRPLRSPELFFARDTRKETP